jgi:hypothetical protein
MRQYRYDDDFMATIRFPRLGALLSGLAILSAACGRADSAPPVATASLAISKASAPLGSPVELTYRFEVAPDAKISRDYRVFVHFNRDDGTMLFSDDHDLPADAQTSAWTPGRVVQYTRTRFVPTLSYIGTVSVEIGLYRDEERLPLAVAHPDEREAAKREYHVATLDLLPRSESIQVIRLSGWHAGEFAPDDATREWQWTQKVATLRFPNPRRDVLFYLEYDARADLFEDQPQRITLLAGSEPVETFAAAELGTFLKKFPIDAAKLGNGEMAELRIEIDRTFVPANLPGGSRDNRELGIRVYHAYVETR